MGGRFGGVALLRAVVLVVALVVAVLVGPVQAQQSTLVHSHVGAVAKAKVPKPKVKKLRPAKGPASGGNLVKVKGKNFLKVKKVTFGGRKATIVQVKNKKKIIVKAPPHAAGVVPVLVKTKGGKSKATKKARYTYIGQTSSTPPKVSSLSPNIGPDTGGTTVQITGTGLTGTTAVTFGGVPATSVMVLSPTLVKAVSPAHAAGTVPVVVKTGVGTSTGVLFTYQAVSASPPVVALVSPLTGSQDGGTAVTITGTDFVGATSVSFGGTPATSFTVDSASSISAITPAHAAGLVAVSVTTPSGTSTVPGLFTYLPLPPPSPVVLLVAPLTGSVTGGTAVTITGTGFSGATAVSFDGIPATTFSVESDTTISATTPAHAAGPVAVAVTTPVGTSAVPGLFTYSPLPTPPPVVALVAPLTGPITGGTSVTITGTGFSGATAVLFDGTPVSFTVGSDISITATTPPHAVGPVTVTVTTPAGSSIVPGLFTYSPLPTIPPVVILVTPPTGSIAGGTAVTITGTGLTGATAVSFGGTAATSFTVNSDTSISATTPAHALGLGAVSVTTPNGTSTVPGLFLFAL